MKEYSLSPQFLQAQLIATGVSALMLGKIPAGSITNAVGLTSSLCCSRLAKDANDRLDKLTAELDHKS
ncbi:MAG: hypothetical protein DCF25_15300 [Leptolyngbya foveolarum]|uniref:Uncharacterized protein n=1 Tax=Leptolyngbya foveolarum TaxID=47253 RepID=A0A2W4U233_9CYAN|nr:MAG: hypothetical protein DCF25_15300 [Leptolyngbya foveolarum]